MNKTSSFLFSCSKFETVWKILKNLNVVYCSWLFWITLKANYYPLQFEDISLSNFWSVNKQPKCLDKWGKIFLSRFFFFKWNKIIIIKKNIPQDTSLYMRLLHQEPKWPICVITRKYPEKNICSSSSFSNNFCYWNVNDKETFLFFS